MKANDVCSYTIKEMNEVCCDDAPNKKIKEKGINGRGFGGSLYLGVWYHWYHTISFIGFRRKTPIYFHIVFGMKINGIFYLLINNKMTLNNHYRNEHLLPAFLFC